MYTHYDYLKIKKDKIELDKLRRQAREQKLQIEGLVERVNSFAVKMEELNQLDKNIGMMANIEDNRYRTNSRSRWINK